METASFRFVLVMQDTYFEHPAEEALERYLLNRCHEDELETVETHLLACESCVSRLENLKLEITAMKQALAQWQEEEAMRSAKIVQPFGWRRWFAVPKLAWAVAVAALALSITLVPHFRNLNGETANVNLSAYRGLETVFVPQGRALHITLNAEDLPSGGAEVSLVDSNGATVWSGPAQIHDNRAVVTVPRIQQAGAYFVRLSSKSSGGTEPELLREFSITVR
jgi:hypothetical protein